MPDTPAQQARVMKQWTAWFTKLGPEVAKGAVGRRASGYSIIEAPSLEKATKLAKSCPVIRGGARVAVYETFNVM